MIRKVLVANRGEIARRVFDTCRTLGIGTVAVYSAPDADARFVLDADEAVPLGGSTPADSYLRADLIIAAARRVGADAIHPGYGFLSENAEFARACAEAGITFVGPDPRAIELMGSKLTARELMADAGVPVLPGRDLTGVADSDVAAIADEIGWPILVKASYGGGGRGMRVVRDEAHLVDAISSARREAGAAFGNDTVFLEHYVDRPRHVEVQIFGDRHGSVVHLNERECSIQRRHQKIIEESPSVAVDDALRRQMGDAAVRAGQVLDYVGAGTVEFLLAPDGRFFFLEVNTRLQVEHPVTEMVTGLDLVRLQLEVADGSALPEELATGIPPHGHAIEARLYAEDPQHDFLPQAGHLRDFDIPTDVGVRVDSGVIGHEEVSPNYDPMLAKVIAHGATRQEAAARLARTLRRSRIHGIGTNRALLVGILEDEAFVRGDIDTHYLDRKPVEELIEARTPQATRLIAVAAALAGQATARASATALPTIPSGFRNNSSRPQERSFRLGGQEVSVSYDVGRHPSFAVDGKSLDVEIRSATATLVDLVVDGVRRRIPVQVDESRVVVDLPEQSVEVEELPRFPDPSAHVQPGSLLAPMPGTVVRVAVAAGQEVSVGDPLVVLEAMKMEHTITADADGVVAELPVSAGEAVDNGQVLVVLQSTDEQEVTS